jgi:hypothetical protein
MSAFIPVFKIRFVFFFMLIAFMLLGLTRRAFAVELDCGHYSISVSSYKTAAARDACYASISAADYPQSYSGTSSAGSAANICLGIDVGLTFKERIKTINEDRDGNGSLEYFVQYGACCVLDSSCVDADADGKCDPCQEERAALASQCGSSGYTMVDEDACEGRCNDCVDEAKEQCGNFKKPEWNDDGDCSYRCVGPCQDLIDRLDYQCGGGDKWYVANQTINPDGSTTDQCSGACGTPPDANQDTDGDGTPDKQDDDIDGDGVPNDQDDDIDGDGIPNGQDSAPTVPGGIDTSKAPTYGEGNNVGTGGSDPGTADPEKPPPDPEKPDPTFDCYEKWNNKIKECGGSANLASWSNETCTGTCKSEGTCTKEQMDAADAACKYGYNMAPDCTYTCIPCSTLQQNCIKSCSPAAVKNNICEEQNGKPVDVLCECENASACEQYKASCRSSCSSSECGGVKNNECQEDSSGKITSKTCECNSCGNPSVPDPKQPDPEDPEDVSGWLKGIKRDTETIAENTYAVKQSIEGLKNALSNVSIKGSEIGSISVDSDLGNSGSITGVGYGSAYIGDDVLVEPSFGTYSPTGSDHRGQVSSALNGVELTAAGSVCEFSLSVPVPRLSGLSLVINWQNFPVNLCLYESMLAIVGSFLVYFTALRELFKFAA